MSVAGVTAVGVLPTHRRRGLLTALMRRQLDDVRAAGESVAALWASERVIYGRFGYGLAARHATVTLRDAGARLRPGLPAPAGRTRSSSRPTPSRAIAPAVRPRPPRAPRPPRPHAARGGTGASHDPEAHRDGRDALRAAVHEAPTGPSTATRCTP